MADCSQTEGQGNENSYIVSEVILWVRHSFPFQCQSQEKHPKAARHQNLLLEQIESHLLP